MRIVSDGGSEAEDIAAEDIAGEEDVCVSIRALKEQEVMSKM
jgi:hypothetical protein